MNQFEHVLNALPAWLNEEGHGVFSFKVGADTTDGSSFRLAIDLIDESHRERVEAKFADWERQNAGKLKFKLHWNVFWRSFEERARIAFFGRCKQSWETLVGVHATGQEHGHGGRPDGRIPLEF